MQNNLIDQRRTYATLVEQSNTDKKKVRNLTRQLDKHLKESIVLLECNLKATKQQEEIVREKHSAQKKASATTETLDRAERELKLLNFNHGTIVKDNVALEIINDKLEKRLSRWSIETIEKVYDKSLSSKGGQKTWPMYMWGIIMEQLVGNTPPAAINHNILSVIKVLSPSMDVKDLPHISTVKRGRRVMSTVSHILAAYKLAKATEWKQIHTDGTS